MLAWVKYHRRKLTALVLICVPLFVVASSAGASVGESTTTPVRWAGGLMGGFQAGMHSVIGTTGGFFRTLTGGDQSGEIEELRLEVEQLREEKTRLIGVLQENSRLRGMVGFQQTHPEFDLVAAEVIARDISPFFRVIKIKIRSSQPLEPRMPVVSAQGVVGQVHRVYEGYADVILVSDPRSRIDAISQRNRTLGVIEGLGHEADYRARVAYVTERDEVRVGDTMVTSGMGGVFPRELIVGEIVEVDLNTEGLFQEVVIEPTVDFARLEEVFVITNVE